LNACSKTNRNKSPQSDGLRIPSSGAMPLPTVSRIAVAQTYPSRPVRWIVGFAPGGGYDVAARVMGQWLSERLGQQFVIENRPGASTNVATEVVVRAPADGYTLLLVGLASAINATLYEKLNFNFIRDIAPVWFGVGAPKGTPAEVIDKLNKEINAGLADPKIKARLEDLGGTPMPMTPASFRNHLEIEVAHDLRGEPPILAFNDDLNRHVIAPGPVTARERPTAGRAGFWWLALRREMLVIDNLLGTGRASISKRPNRTCQLDARIVGSASRLVEVA
jgi:hypothetical protein